LRSLAASGIECNLPTALGVLLLLVAPALSSPAAGDGTSLLVPPARPVVVAADVVLEDIAIDDSAETFEFSGVVTLEWRDPRQAFDPAAAGEPEKWYQGTYQFDEISPAWYPQLVLVNASGAYEQNGVSLRVMPDGTSKLSAAIHASAKADMDMTWYPYDRQRLEAVFEVLGADHDEVVFRRGLRAADAADVRVPQWTVTGVDVATRDRAAAHAGRSGIASAVVVSIDVERNSFFARRLLVLPLIVVVLLSFAVFWMDRSSLGDRLNVSFIGILTAVTYQLVTSDQLPRIAYPTLMHGFLGVSFLVMCATVVVNLVVGAMDKRGKSTLGDRVDYWCRWVFPSVYLGVLLSLLLVEKALR
jgi:Neurotransmitter-gated ion-channel ligand binding domain/Neurotransmitter-gated ion-channel transmembrane region